MGAYYTTAQTYSTTFGVDIYAPKDVVYNVQVTWGRILANFPHLIQQHHVWTETDIQGRVHLRYDIDAQALFAAAASDWASTNTNNPQSVLMQPGGSTIYKTKFKELINSYMNYYIPGTTIQILNVNQPGTTNATISNNPNC